MSDEDRNRGISEITGDQYLADRLAPIQRMSNVVDELVRDLIHQKDEVKILRERLSASELALWQSNRELEHVRDVLKWASENVGLVRRQWDSGEMFLACSTEGDKTTAPTLFGALEKAWSDRQDKPVQDAPTAIAYGLYKASQRPVI